MAYLAEDSLGHSKETKLNPHSNHMPETRNNTLPEQFQLFNNLPQSICHDLYFSKVSSPLDSYSDCFEDSSGGLFIKVSEKGMQKLKNEYPDIYNEFSTH